MELTLINFCIYIAFTWGSNILLNFLYVAKRYITWFAKLDRPIDFRKKWYGNRLIGDSTTIFGILITIITTLVIYMYSVNVTYTLIPYFVYAGHMTGSFIKRRLGKEDGTFVPFIDHGDYMIFTGATLVFLNRISIDLALVGLIFTYGAHPLACLIAYKLKLREYPY